MMSVTVLRGLLCVLGLMSYVTADCHNESLLSTCNYKCGESVPHKTYWVQDSISNYLRVTDLPAMSELTACFYYDPAGLPPTSDPWLISIASAGNFNAFILGSMGRKGLSMHVESDANTITNDLEAFDSAHKHCFVWSDGNYMKWFYDKNTPGVMELAARVGDSGRQSIPAGSSMTLLNEQDNLGGGLAANQMTPGHLADFQMWNRAFSDAEVEDLRCGAVGNVVTFEDLETVGKANFRYGGNFECACVMEVTKVVT